MIAPAPGLGQEREGAAAHGPGGSGEQGLDLALIAPGAFGGEPAAALEVEVLAVIGGKGAAGRGVAPRLDPAAAPPPRFDILGVGDQVGDLF